jgi:hypothetical protein
MENQHREIAGYGELNEGEIAGINRTKQLAEEVGLHLDALLDVPGIDKRALAIAKTDLQTGFMWAVRAIAQPGTF